MNEAFSIQIDDRWILLRRAAKNRVDPRRPVDYLVEKERTAEGQVEDVATIFLTNLECPFRCLMCDLWQNTTAEQVPEGAIPEQIQWAISRLPSAKHVKLYNSGNFFDERAIPPEEIPKAVKLVEPFKTVTIENHPRLVDNRCLEFQNMLSADLQVAMGLETVHPEVLEKLNKRMTLTDFEHAAHFLTKNDISVRAFILLKPPFLDEAEGVFWAKRSIDFAFDSGVECCVIIPTRGGNGALDRLRELGAFLPPEGTSLEEVIAYGIQRKQGRVFADLWNIEQFLPCDQCREQRVQRLRKMNLTQEIISTISCNCKNAL